MRKVEKRMCLAMERGDNLTVGHDTVETRDGHSRWYLWDNEIVDFNRISREITFSDADYQTTTTKSRLNAAGFWLAGNSFKLWQVNGRWLWRFGDSRPHFWDGDVVLLANDGIPA